jgi:hypothetical protein
MNKNLIIAGSILVVGVVIYFVWKSKKKSTTTTAAQTTGPQPGGAFAPKILTEQDFLQLETIFKDGNPFNDNLAKAIEGQAEDENQPLKNGGGQKTLLTKQQFDNLVLARIRNIIGQRGAWIQDEENRRFEEWRGAVRAGYANTLAQAFAYAIRTYTAKDNYYTGTPNTPSGSGSGSGSESQPDYKSMVTQENLKILDWGPTNISFILTAMTMPSPGSGATATRQYWDINKRMLISKTEARSKGVTTGI